MGLSPWWRHATILVLVVGFGVLIWLTARTHDLAPPIPETLRAPPDAPLFTRDENLAGQESSRATDRWRTAASGATAPTSARSATPPESDQEIRPRFDQGDKCAAPGIRSPRFSALRSDQQMLAADVAAWRWERHRFGVRAERGLDADFAVTSRHIPTDYLTQPYQTRPRRPRSTPWRVPPRRRHAPRPPSRSLHRRAQPDRRAGRGIPAKSRRQRGADTPRER